MPTDRNRTRGEKRALNRMTRTLIDEMRFFDMYGRYRNLVPDNWEHIHTTHPPKRKKIKITLRVEEDVVKWYRKVGFGYQARMNDVLRAYMDSVISKYIETEEDRTYDGKPI